MKNLLLAGFMVFLLVGSTGCSKEETVKIDEHDWNLTFVLSSEDGRVLGCAPEHYEAHKEDENIKEMNLDCVVSDGEYTLLLRKREQEWQ